jgi:DNA mismatch endonuclease Vsr
MDIFTTEQRSRIMRQIKGKDTKPELIVRKYLFSKGFRYRINVKGLPGKPDIVLKKYHTSIFVHGCFWHGHENCKIASKPQTNSAFWNQKISRNKERDLQCREKLKNMGWNTMVVWECQLRTAELRKRTLQAIVDLLDETLLRLNRSKAYPKHPDIRIQAQNMAAEPSPTYASEEK